MEILKKEIAYDGFFKIKKVTVAQHGHTFTREQFDRGDAVAALVHDTVQDRFILTKQYRIGSESDLIEVVAGMVDAGEAPEESIAREIEEEIGYRVIKLEYMHTFYPSPGACTEKILLYFAEVAEQHAAGGGNAHEQEHIEIVRLTPAQFEQLQTPDAKTIIAQQWLKLRQLQG